MGTDVVHPVLGARARLLAALVAALALLAALLPHQAAVATEHDGGLVIEDGRTQPVFSYDDAIRERVWVESAMDSDGSGRGDLIRADIMRPAETEDGLRVSTIYEISPYRAGLNPLEMYDVDVDLEPVGATPPGPRRAGAGGPNPAVSEPPHVFPGYYDNYFVPRGYAVVLAEAPGSGMSEGCPTSGGENETAGTVAVIDWLNGRATAYDADGNEVTADWANGSVGMTGVSYNGTLPNAAATTGVEGLKTIVPIVAISSWYDYFRANGTIKAPGGWQGEDADVLAKAVLTRDEPAVCDDVIDAVTEGQDRRTGDYNAFWDERNYVNDVGNVTASVFVVHGMNDWNVKTNQFAQWWYALDAHNVPRKLWIHNRGHSSPDNFRRAVWRDTLHGWFDYWLYDVVNEVPDDPMVSIERTNGVWEEHTSWPDAATATTSITLTPGGDEGDGGLTTERQRGSRQAAESFTDDATRTPAQLVANPQAADPNRLAYRSAPLDEPVRISGNPEVRIRASLDSHTANLTALLVDYGPDGTDGAPGSARIVSRGWMDPQNRTSKSQSVPVVPGVDFWFQWDLQAKDHVFAEGHRVGLVLIQSDSQHTLRPPPGRELTVLPQRSELLLPVVGGAGALGF